MKDVMTKVKTNEDGTESTTAQCPQCHFEFEDINEIPERCPGCRMYLGPVKDNCRITGGDCGE